MGNPKARTRAMKGSLLAWFVLLAVAAASARAGTVHVHEIESTAVAGNLMGISPTRRLLVYLPEDYAATRRSYPVIYWIPGWETPASREYVAALDAAIGKGWMPPAIVVSIDVSEGIVLLNSPVFGQWEDFVVDEVVPFVDNEYRTIPRADGRAVMGHSTGGYGAMMFGARYPEVWGAVGLNDASVWAGCSLPIEGFPSDFDAYAESSGYMRAWTQVAIAAAYDPASPLLFQVPAADVGGQVTEPDWEPYCLYNAAAMELYREALLGLAIVEVLVASGEGGISNKWPNGVMWGEMQALGVKGRLTEMPGTHGGDRANRFILLARRILPHLHRGYPDPRARATPWADLRAERALGAR